MAAFTDVNIDSAAIKAKILAASDSQVRDAAVRAGKQMAKRATTLMDQDFNLNRPYERRRHPGSRRAATAISSEVERNGPASYIVRYKILGGPIVEARIAGLNYGTPGHAIYPTGNWPLKNSTLAIRNTPRRTGRARTNILAVLDPSTGEDWGAAYLNHPGSRGTSFLERARDEVVATF